MEIIPLYLQIGRTERIRFTGIINKVAVACCDLDLTVNNDVPQVATLYSVYTHPYFRGNGYARSLLSLAIETAESYGRSVIVLSVHRENAPAINFYEGMGFMPCGTEGEFDHYAYWLA